MSNDMCASVCSNTLSYQGNVSITLRKDGHSYPFNFHNAGTKHLFDTITKSLAGYSVADSIPARVDVQQKLKSDQWATCLKNSVPFTGIVYGEAAEATSNDGKLLLNAVLTYEDKRPITTLSTPRIVVLDSKSRILAYIENEQLQQLWDQVTEDTEAIIMWTMIFKDAGGLV